MPDAHKIEEFVGECRTPGVERGEAGLAEKVSPRLRLNSNELIIVLRLQLRAQ